MSKLMRNQKFSTVFFFILSIGIVLAAWHLAVTLTDLGTLFPAPIPVFELFLSSLTHPIGQYTLIQHTVFSLYRVFVGFGLGSVVGIVLGIAMGRIRVIDAIVKPIFNLIRPIPGVAWIPMAILWFGIGETTKYFIIFMGGFANVLLNVYAGAKTVDTQLMGAARMLGASERQVFIHIVLPASVPYIFAGLQVSLSTSWMAVLAAEMVCAQEGAGYLIIGGMNSGNTTQILVGMLAIGIVGLILASIMRIAEKRLCSWKIRGN
ncbi:MAG TPA: ABC transporter permease [Candidatus Mediterraneibacter ornithocaccae]|nr:ABC transporter permease [Candidatus Mediterraneibacter ornithocaccae]